jgi:hypothetical protein
MSKKMLSLAAAGAVALTLAACGDDGDDSSSATDATSATTISKEDFVSQGNEICTDGNKALQEAAQESFPNGEQPSGDELGAFVTDSLVPNIQSQLDDIKALGIPEGEEDQVNAFLDDAQSALDDLKDDPQSLGNDTFAEVNQEAGDIGLTACAS